MARPSAARRSKKPTTLGSLTPGERGKVLDALVAQRPELEHEAERLAAELLSSASIDDIAAQVEVALVEIPLDALGSRAGRVRGRGYVHEVDAAWELVEEVIGPFRSDVERRASLGSADAAATLAVGTVAGLYRVREPEMGTVLAYAGEEAPYELASGVLELAARLGVEVPEDVGDDHWPDWVDLP